MTCGWHQTTRSSDVQAASGDVAGGAGDFVEEGAELGGIFFAGAGFDSAGYIDGVGPNDADGFGDVFGGESTCKDDAMGLCEGAGEVPVADGAGAAVVSGERRVQKESGGATKAGKIRRGSSLTQAHDLDDRQTARDAIDNLRRFIAVKLCRGKMQGLAKRHDRRVVPVHEHADERDKRGDAADQFRGREGCEAAWAAVEKIQAKGVGAEFGGEFGVFQFGDATDFDANHYGQCSGRVWPSNRRKRDPSTARPGAPFGSAQGKPSC